MRKGLRFQTRLMLAFLLATSIVCVAVIELTSTKVKQTYKRQFKENFNAEINYLVDARNKRAASQFALGNKLAASNFVIDRLLDPKEKLTDEVRKAFLDNLPQPQKPGGGPGGKEKGSRGMSSRIPRILAVMDMSGEVFHLTPPSEHQSYRPKRRMNKEVVQERLQSLKDDPKQQIAYVPHTFPGGESMIREVSVTPVKHPDSKDVIGALLMSLTTTETYAERVLDRYHKEVTDGHFENAIFLEDELYSSGVFGMIREESHHQLHLDDLENAVRGAIAELPPGKFEGNFEWDIHGEPHYVHFRALNAGSPLSTAWQVSGFPMSQLMRELYDLRIKGSGIGLIGILLGLLSALFLSRKIAIPIRELSEGVTKIGEGNFETQLPVRSHDEIGELTESFNRMAGELRQKEMYRSLLAKVSDESVAQAMIEGTLNPHLGGEIKKVSVLFCDIRGFTTLTEEMRPEEVIEMLNIHMTAMTRVVREHFGVVDKFVGDEIMAVFGGLKSYGNDAANAAHCAVKMVEERERINRETGTDIQIGIGLATGEIVAGCMGSEDRLNYTVLGARVNLGARLCGRAGPGEIVIDDETFAAIAEMGPVTESLEGMLLKGFKAEVKAWKLSHAGERAALATFVTS